MHSSSTGFTLIELMIVVAVVGILAAASIPLYQGYVIKTQVNRVVAELGAYRSAFEVGMARSKSIDNAFLGYSPSDLTTGDSPTDIATINADGSGHIQVTLGGNAHPDVAGTIIRLERNAAGEWQCVIDTSAARRWKSAYAPGHCSAV